LSRSLKKRGRKP
jgi:transposase